MRTHRQVGSALPCNLHLSSLPPLTFRGEQGADLANDFGHGHH
jgi:hypothetical protein